jgi:uncharacterized protein
VFAAMAEKYPNLYGDNSAFNIPTRRLTSGHLDRCITGSLAGRILHGSDAPVPVLAHGAYLRGHVSRRAFKLSRKEVNPLERDYLLKRAMGFPDESFTRAADVLKMNTIQRPVSAKKPTEPQFKSTAAR